MMSYKTEGQFFDKKLTPSYTKQEKGEKTWIKQSFRNEEEEVTADAAEKTIRE